MVLFTIQIGGTFLTTLSVPLFGFTHSQRENQADLLKGDCLQFKSVAKSSNYFNDIKKNPVFMCHGI